MAASDDTEEAAGAGLEWAFQVLERGEIGVIGVERVQLFVFRSDGEVAEEKEWGFGGGEEVDGGEIRGGDEREP